MFLYSVLLPRNGLTASIRGVGVALARALPSRFLFTEGLVGPRQAAISSFLSKRRDSASGTRTEVPKRLTGGLERRVRARPRPSGCWAAETRQRKHSFFETQKKRTHALTHTLTHTHKKHGAIQTRRPKLLFITNLPPNHGWRRLPQRVAMDDLASYFVEERSKVR